MISFSISSRIFENEQSETCVQLNSANSFIDGPFVIIEYVPYGDLLGYLRRSRGATDRYYDEPEIEPTTNLTSQQMLKYAWQITDAMRYIASKKVHGALHWSCDLWEEHGPIRHNISF